jgi:hypothetical protein
MVLDLSVARKGRAGTPREKPIIVFEPPGGSPEVATKREAGPPVRVAAEGEWHGGVLLGPVPEILLAHLDLRAGFGLLVRAVDRKSASSRSDLAALKQYDVITHVDQDRVGSVKDLRQASERRIRGETYHLRVLRKGTVRILRVRR